MNGGYLATMAILAAATASLVDIAWIRRVNALG
jgi:hypothetical protein